MDTPTYAPNGRILVVDDNAHALQAMSELLESEGFSALTARNGLDALKKMRAAEHVSLVLWISGGQSWDGREVLRRKARDAGIAKIPVIVVSAVPPDSPDGVEAILKKPVCPEHLLEMVRRFSN
jgi:CheY-like chemotaxis protein